MTTAERNRISVIRAIAGSTMLLASAALGAPQGGDVVEGEATIEYDGNWTRVLTGEITIIDWLSFNIAQGETVEFIMPSEASRVLNRITNGVPTEIMGNLLANGQVFIVNPSGVIFGQNAVVDVGALYAAAGNISNSDFTAGVYRFTDARGIVENRGLLKGDLIAMVGGRVANHGTISAPSGTVVMAAGEQVLIGELLGHTFVRLERPSDLENTPTLETEGVPALAAGDVFSLAAWNTGTVEAKDTTVAVSSGHMAIDSDLTAGEISLVAEGDSHIELGADLHSTGPGLVITGDVVLTDDVSVTSEGSVIAFKGRVDSVDGAEHDLLVDTDGGPVRFYEDIGSRGRLGTLEVSAGLTRFFADVSVNEQLNLYTPVAITGLSTTFDVGMGTALFADQLYSAIGGRSDVSFVYGGEAWVGEGEARTPFSFRSGIGVDGAFRSIVFGGDLSDPARAASFVFATGATEGLGLIGAGTDLGAHFLVKATESITMGVGQKITSFGSLTLNASGAGRTRIGLGDINALGDLRVESLGASGGEIVFNTRAPGLVDWYGNEGDRSSNALTDEGLELIASGDITLVGALGGDTAVSLGSGGSVRLLNNAGSGDAGSLEIDQYPGGVTLDLFSSLLSSPGDLYPYDLTLIPEVTEPLETEANLAEALAEEAPVTLRTDEPYLADREVLSELGLQPRDPENATVLASVEEGTRRYLDHEGTILSDGAMRVSVTLDRLNRSSVSRLMEAYLALLGQRTGDGSERANDDRVREAVSRLMSERDASVRDIAALLASGRIGDESVRETLVKLARVMEAIDLLELSPLEIAQAKRALIGRYTANPERVIDRWFSPAPMALSKP